MKKPTVILTYPQSFGPPHGGGKVHCARLARALEQLGTKVLILTTARPNSDATQELAVPAFRVSASRVHYLLDGLPMAKTVKAILAQEDVAAVIGWDHEATFLPSLLRRKGVVFGMIGAAPFYRSTDGIYGAGSWSPKNLASRWFRQRPVRLADVVFTASQFTRCELIAAGVAKERIVCAPLGVDETIRQIPRRFGGRITRLIFFGPLVPAKGILDVLEALGKLAASGKRDWKLKIAGWGDESLVWKTAQQFAIQDLIAVLGSLDRPALVRELEWAQLAILPSHVESFGLAIAEAQAAGLPVIAYRAGAVPEIVEDGSTGWLIPAGRTDLLSTAVGEAMESSERSFVMGLTGRKRMDCHFSWERSAAVVMTSIAKLSTLRKITPNIGGSGQ